MSLYVVVFAKAMTETKSVVNFGRNVVIMSVPGKVFRQNDLKISMGLLVSNQLAINRIHV